jgi:hypothetical protein
MSFVGARLAREISLIAWQPVKVQSFSAGAGHDVRAGRAREQQETGIGFLLVSDNKFASNARSYKA